MMAEMYRATVTRTNPGQAWVHVPYLHPDAEWGPFPAVDGIKAGDAVVAVSTDEAIDGDFIIVNGVGPGSGSAGVGPNLHLTGTLQVDGVATLNGATTVDDTLHVTGNATFNGHADFVAASSEMLWFDALTLFNNAGGQEVFGARIAGDAESRLAIQSGGHLMLGNGIGGQDWDLYHVDTNLAELDGKLTVWTSDLDFALSVGTFGDSNQSLFIDSEGGHYWTNGTASSDVSMVRSAPGELTINGDLIVKGVINSNMTTHKTSEPQRNSNTTLSADPELITSSLPAGLYKFELLVWYQTTATAGFKYRLNSTGTAGTDWSVRYSTIASDALVFDATATTIAGVDTNFHRLKLEGTIQITNGPRSITFDWCQGTSNAGPTKVLLNSSFWVYRI